MRGADRHHDARALLPVGRASLDPRRPQPREIDAAAVGLRLRHLRPQRRRARRAQGAGQRGRAPRARLRDAVNNAQQEVLNPEGINCLRFFEGRGYPASGARARIELRPGVEVRQRPPLLRLPRALDRPGHAVGGVRAQRRAAVGQRPRAPSRTSCYNEWRQRRTARRARPRRRSSCAATARTMTQNDLDNGRLICLIGVAPLQPGRVRHLPHRPEDRRRPVSNRRTWRWRPMREGIALQPVQLPGRRSATSGPNGPQAGFQEVSGSAWRSPSPSTAPATTNDNAPIKITGTYKVPDVTLKRGVIGDLDLYELARRGPQRQPGPTLRDGDDRAPERGPRHGRACLEADRARGRSSTPGRRSTARAPTSRSRSWCSPASGSSME